MLIFINFHVVRRDDFHPDGGSTQTSRFNGPDCIYAPDIYTFESLNLYITVTAITIIEIKYLFKE